MSKLAVFFPGIGYNLDKPLMYFSRDLAWQLGYEEKLLPYGNFPKKIPGDTDRIKKSIEIAYEQSREMLADVDFSSYEDILFVGKSIGTAVAARLASESPVSDRIRLVLYTPLPETFSYDFGQAVVFTGTDDPWVGKENSPVPKLSNERSIPCHIVPGANHSLEVDNVHENIRQLKKIMKKTEKFIGGDL